MKKRIKKILVYLLLLLFVVVPSLFAISMQTVFFQTILFEKLAKDISGKMGGMISFEDIYISLFKGVSINGLYIEDANNDTLLYAEKFLVELGGFDMEESKVEIKGLYLENGFYNLYSINEREQTNMQHILNFFSLSESQDTSRSVFFLNADYVDIKNLRFKYRRLNPDSTDYGINFDDLYLHRFDLEAQNFKMINDSMNLDIVNISLDEKSGFKLDELKGHAIISSTEITVDNLVLKTPVSHVFALNYSMRYAHWSEMSDFLNNVKLELNLQLSSVNISDISFFAPIFKNINLPTYVRGRIYGPISNLKSKRLLLSMGRNSRIETRFSMQGLPNIEETFLSLDIKKIDISIEDVEDFLANQNDNVKRQLPELLKRVGDLSYRGNVTGFLNDLVAYGTFKNQHGVLDTDVRYKYKPKAQSLTYSGEVNTKGLDLSVLNLSDTLFGKLTMSAQILVEVDSIENVMGNLEGEIASVGINNYSFKDIQIAADFKDLRLISTLELNDTNIYANIKSEIDFSLNEPYFDFEAELKNAYLSRINWVDRDSSSNLSFRVDAQFSSLELNKIFGEFTIDSLMYIEKNDTVFAEAVNLQSLKNERNRFIEVESDLFRASFEGDFLIEDLVKHFKKLTYSYLPSFVSEYNEKKLPQQEIKYDINLKNTYSAFQIFSPKLIFANQTLLRGNYSSINDSAVMYFYTDSCWIDDYYAESIEIDLNGDYEKLHSEFKAEYFQLSKELFFKNITLRNTLESDSLSVFLSWKNKANSEIDDAEIMAEIIFNPSNSDSLSLDISMVPSYLHIEDSVWYINDASIKLRGPQIAVEQLIVNHDNQYLYADGVWQKGQSDSLHIILNRIDLAYFPLLEEKTTLKMRALVDGDILMSYSGDQALASGYITADTLKINDRLLGNTKINLEWEPKQEYLLLNLENNLGKKNFKSIKSNGYIDIKNSKLNLDISLNKQKLSFFSPFVDEYLSEVQGFVSGDLNINGPLSNLEYVGGLHFVRASLIYKYLGVKYNFSDSVRITKNSFEFDNLKIFEYEGKGDYATVNGYIQHDNFSDFNFFINIDTKEFMVLNTGERDNSLYYGTAFLTGLTQITGTQDNLRIDISAETNKGTRFYIPLSDAEEAAGSEFISFENKGPEKRLVKDDEYKLDLSGIELDFNLTVTPEAEVQLIFDDKLGDVVKARGEGDLNLKINTLGNFLMSGSYSITRGEYLFTLQNVINKKFKIEPGSDIKWNGDPYQAYLNIDAVYRLKTPIYDLTLNPDDKERIPVECHLNMEKSLLSPEISFDIKLPSSGDRAKNLINSMDQDEKNKQLLSLLVLSKFYTPDYLVGGEETGSGNSVGKNASELLSNQLSNWLSQISDDFDIGVNYRPGDEISNDELELALSTQLFNDRVAIDGNVGVSDYEKTSSNVVGNVNVDVKINKKGNVRVRGFNRVNENEMENSSLYTQGVGLYYREDFDTFGGLMKKYWKLATLQKRDSVQ